MDRLHEGAAGVLLRAVPVKTGGTGKVDGGFIFAGLKDPRSNDLIDCRIPEALARGAGAATRLLASLATSGRRGF